MKRRTFLIGTGSAAIGGSALLGSGAFSRVESQRSVTIQVAEDPDAYLGMDKCSIDGSETPNSSYAHLDEKGHLEILMNPENPTIPESPLGEGINSDSRMWVDNVFQLCNQGKEDVCVYIEDDDDWPRAPEEYDEERRVDFYLGADREGTIVGEDNEFLLELGECVCVGLKTNSKSLSEGDELLEALDNEIRIVADVEGNCLEPEFPECPFYGTTREDPTAINSILYDADADEIIETQVGDIPDDSPGDSNYPNGVAFDDPGDVWYFAEDDGTLKTMNEDGALGIEEYGVVTPGGEAIAGAAFWDETGEYLFIPQGGDTLRAADISGGDAETRVVAALDWSGIGLGDLAIDRFLGILYVSVVSSSAGSIFFSVDLDDTDDQELIVSDSADSTEFATGKQIAFAEGTLWAHEASGGDWWTVDVSDGSMGDVVDTTQEYTDLARCGFAEWELP